MYVRLQVWRQSALSVDRRRSKRRRHVETTEENVSSKRNCEEENKNAKIIKNKNV
jgi:hypothetical protein